MEDVKSCGDLSEVSQSQHTSGYLEDSGEYCYPANPKEQKPKPINSHNGEIEKSTEPHVYVQIYKPDIISMDFKCIEFENTYKYSGLKCLKIFSAVNKNLQKLKISWKDYFKSSMLEELAPLWPNLNYISLINCDMLTSESLVTLATRCKQIRTILLEGVSLVKDFAVIPFINNDCLECLNMAECRITDDTLFRLAEHKMDRMKELDLTGCTDVSSVGLDKLFENTSDTLYKLRMRKVAANDHTFLLIASNFCHLTSLNIPGINGLNDDAVVNLVEHIRTLEHVDFSWNLDLRQWRGYRAWLRQTLNAKSAAAADDAGSASDEEFTDLDICMPHRSTVYGTDLNFLYLQFCTLVRANHLSELGFVCRCESITIYNCYGKRVKPELSVGDLFSV